MLLCWVPKYQLGSQNGIGIRESCAVTWFTYVRSVFAQKPFFCAKTLRISDLRHLLEGLGVVLVVKERIEVSLEPDSDPVEPSRPRD